LLALPKGVQNLPWATLAWIVAAGTGARTAALALNRLIDRELDARNPRTASRELPAKALSLKQAWGIFTLGCAVYVLAAAELGPLCLALSPLPLIVFAAYPLMKRYTWTAHFGVGCGLALAPLGGYIGVADALPTQPGPWWLAAFTLCWVAGFDVLYACLDEAFDRKEGLFSIPARFGRAVALNTGLGLHGLAFLCLAALRWSAFAAKPAWIWVALLPAVALLALEQRYGYSLEKDSPFFKINAWIGVAVFAYIAIGVY
jgi:4-hydroxybenzoate polyprenyltransferase